MKINLIQLYIEVGISYPFSHIAQGLLCDALSAIVLSSEYFDKKCPDFTLTFYMSAKALLTSPDIRGPSVRKKDKSVEYFIYLPFIHHDRNNPESLKQPLKLFLDAVMTVLQGLQVDTTTLAAASDDLIERILSDPEAICDY